MQRSTANTQTVIESTIIDEPCAKIWHFIKKLDFAALQPELIKHTQFLQGKAGEVGCIQRLEFDDGFSQNLRIEEVSDRDMMIKFKVIDSVPRDETIGCLHKIKLSPITEGRVDDTASQQTFIKFCSEYSSYVGRDFIEASKQNKINFFLALKNKLRSTSPLMMEQGLDSKYESNVQNLQPTVAEKAENVATNLLEKGKNVVSNIAQTTKNVASNLVEKGKDLVEKTSESVSSLTKPSLTSSSMKSSSTSTQYQKPPTISSTSSTQYRSYEQPTMSGSKQVFEKRTERIIPATSSSMSSSSYGTFSEGGSSSNLKLKSKMLSPNMIGADKSCVTNDMIEQHRQVFCQAANSAKNFIHCGYGSGSSMEWKQKQLPNITKDMYEQHRQVFRQAANKAKDFTSRFVDKSKQMQSYKGGKQLLSTTCPSTESSSPSLIGSAIEKVKDVASSAVEKVKDVASNVASTVASKASAVKEVASDVASNVASKTANAAIAAKDVASDAATTLAAKTANAASSLKQSVKPSSDTPPLTSSLASATKDVATTVAAKAASAASTLAEVVKPSSTTPSLTSSLGSVAHSVVDITGSVASTVAHKLADTAKDLTSTVSSSQSESYESTPIPTDSVPTSSENVSSPSLFSKITSAVSSLLPHRKSEPTIPTYEKMSSERETTSTTTTSTTTNVQPKTVNLPQCAEKLEAHEVTHDLSAKKPRAYWSSLPSKSTTSNADYFNKWDFSHLDELTQKELSDLWSVFDTNHDGVLTKDEVLSIAEALLTRIATNQSDVSISFQKLMNDEFFFTKNDREPSHTLTHWDQPSAHWEGEQCPDNVLKQAKVSLGDKDLNGIWRNQLMRNKRIVVQQLGGQLDADRDGNISKQEFQALFPTVLRKEIHRFAAL